MFTHTHYLCSGTAGKWRTEGKAGTIPCSPSINNVYTLRRQAGQVVQIWQAALIRPQPQASARSVRHGDEGAVVENAEMWALCLCRQCWLPAPSPCQFPSRLAPWGAAPRRTVATSSRDTDCQKASVYCRPVSSASYAASRHGPWGGRGWRDFSLLGLGGWGLPLQLCLARLQGYSPRVLALTVVIPEDWVGPTG